MTDDQQKFHDDQVLHGFVFQMRDRLDAKRGEGKSGWHDPNRCSLDGLAWELLDRLTSAKGDLIGVANFAMFLHNREGGTEALARIADRIMPTEKNQPNMGGTKSEIDFTEWYARFRCLAQGMGFPEFLSPRDCEEAYDRGDTPGDFLREELHAAAETAE